MLLFIVVLLTLLVSSSRLLRSLLLLEFLSLLVLNALLYTSCNEISPSTLLRGMVAVVLEAALAVSLLTRTSRQMGLITTRFLVFRLNKLRAFKALHSQFSITITTNFQLADLSVAD